MHRHFHNFSEIKNIQLIDFLRHFQFIFKKTKNWSNIARVTYGLLGKTLDRLRFPVKFWFGASLHNLLLAFSEITIDGQQNFQEEQRLFGSPGTIQHPQNPLPPKVSPKPENNRGEPATRRRTEKTWTPNPAKKFGSRAPSVPPDSLPRTGIFLRKEATVHKEPKAQTKQKKGEPSRKGTKKFDVNFTKDGFQLQGHGGET